MKNQLPEVQENLSLGIKAARTGQNEEARVRLKAVLEQDPNHIIALFWLAFVAPEPEESIHLLERVLELDPENQRAKAGIVWAQQQMTGGVGEDGTGQSDVTSDAEAEQSSSDQSLRDQFLSGSDDIQQRAKKGILAHRARRTIDPLLVLVVILGVVTLLTLSILRGYPDFLEVGVNDFLSSSDRAPVTHISEEVEFKKGQVLAHQEVPPSENFTSQSDLLLGEMMQTRQGNLGEAEPAALPFITSPNGNASQIANPIEEMRVKSEPVEFIGPADLIPGEFRLFQPVDEALLAHQPASPDEKWIEVDVTAQRVTAWEGNTPVMSFLSSTGLPGTPTVLGKFNIYWKLESTLMAGPGYYLPDVPYTMYFYRGYALHGAYWHDNFGQPMSHGCVNLSNENAQALFEWAGPALPAGQTQVVSGADNPGTLVVVHD